jgi:hypothetical protein
VRRRQERWKNLEQLIPCKKLEIGANNNFMLIHGISTVRSYNRATAGVRARTACATYASWTPDVVYRAWENLWRPKLNVTHTHAVSHTFLATNNKRSICMLISRVQKQRSRGFWKFVGRFSTKQRIMQCKVDLTVVICEHK